MIDLRVPRTKEEIEANYEKRQAAHQYVNKLGRMEFSGLKLKSQALIEKVSLNFLQHLMIIKLKILFDVEVELVM